MLRRPLRLALVVLVLGAVAVPLVAYVAVPQLVRKTVVEPPPANETIARPAPASTDPAAQVAAPPATEVRLAGMLQRIDAVHFGSGSVKIVGGGDRVLRFEGVAIAGAPDMYVYLSDRADGQPGRFVNLGKLKATDGSFNYPIPSDVDLAGVHSLVIWCRAFSVTVTWAPLA